MDTQWVFILLIGFVTSFLSNISGGGGSLIQLPALMAIGISPLNAIGTIKVGSLGLVAGSIMSAKDKQVVRKDYVWKLIIIVTIASIVGPFIVFRIDENLVKIISSLFIVAAAIASIVTWKMASASRKVSNLSQYLGYGGYFITTVLLAGFGSGIGVLSNYILIGLLGMSAVETVATRRVAGIIGVPLQFLAFALTGHIAIGLGVALLVGSVGGSYLGLRVAIKQGNNFVKWAMAVVSITLVGSLFI